MTNQTRTLRVAAVAAALLLAAGAAFAQDTGSADFTRFVAVGDSLTAGFASGGLHEDVQRNSYPALIARQVGIAGFEQPLAGAPGIPPLLALQSLIPGPVITPRATSPGPPLNLTLPRPYDNMAVPGFTVRDVIVTRTGNGIIDLVLRGLGTELELAAAQQPTFASVWIGNNDVLAAATSGLVIEGVTLTPVAEFQADYQTILGALAQGGAQLVVATLPNVTAIAFVNAIPPVVVDPVTRQPVLIGGQPIPLIGPSGPLSLADKVLLTASSLLAQGIGVPAQVGGTGLPLPDEVVLSAAEVQAIQTRTNEYNDIIRSAAAQFGAALVPVDTIFDELAVQGYPVGGGLVYTTDFLTGGIFSYDGVHPSPFGYALIANEFIAAINQRYGASIPPVDLFPFVFGSEGSAGATVPDNSSAAALAGAVFTKRAGESLLQALRIHVRRRPARPVDGEGPGPVAGPGDGGEQPVIERPILRHERPGRGAGDL